MSQEITEPRAFALPGARPQYGPDKLVAVEHLDLHLTPHLADESLDGICTTIVRALDEPVARLTLDAVDLDILLVRRRLDEEELRDLRFATRGEKLEIEFDRAIAAGERATLIVHYRVVKPRHGLFFVKPSSAHPEKIPHAWTQSQDQYARFWFPCLDYPHEKQSTSTTIVVPKGMFALGNGELVERRDNGDQSIFRYRQDVPHSTYLMTMVVGPFVEIGSGPAGENRTPIFYYVLPGREADGNRAFANTPKMLELFEQRIGTPYPYARYSQIAVSDFIFGGMENTSATTQTDRTLHDEIAHLDFSSDPLVSHELAHQWFGNLLTCRDWSHAWLNEGFATFMEAVWREADLGTDEYHYDMFECLTMYLKESADRYDRPIVCNTFHDPIEIFDRHLYQKGAAVLHMLRGELGDARFWRAVRLYVARNAQRNVETIDLVRAIEEATGRNLRGFFNQWVLRGGHPAIEIRATWDAKRNVATVSIDQNQPIDEQRPAYQFDVELAFSPADSSQERRIRARVERQHETIAVPLEFEPALVRFDPGAFILGDITYALGVEFAAAALRDDANIVGRIRAARELAKDGGRQATEALERAFGHESYWGVLVEAAAAIGATRASWALPILIEALGHRHPKVVRAAAAALGNFREESAASALIAAAENHRSYFVRGAALTALGKTRDRRAFDVLVSAVRGRTWNGVMEAGAVNGLAELAEAKALPLVLAACKPQQSEGLRRGAVSALGRMAELLQSERTRIVDRLRELLDDETFLVAIESVGAAERVGDPSFLPILDRLSQQAFDGRMRRDAAEAAIAIRKGAKVPAQVTALRDDVDELRQQQHRLQEQIATLARP